MRLFAAGILIFVVPVYAADARGGFSHKRHAPLKLKCTFCHAGSQKNELAGLPGLAQCRSCHVTFGQRHIPSHRVYQLPDFVFFSHGRHAAAKMECRSCHGEVMQQDTEKAEHPMKMKWCVDCHKQAKAATACNTCHELGQ